MTYDTKVILKGSFYFTLGIGVLVLTMIYIDWKAVLLASMGFGLIENGIGVISKETKPVSPFINKK